MAVGVAGDEEGAGFSLDEKSVYVTYPVPYISYVYVFVLILVLVG